ncbi:MAG TPA: phosphate--AMP phosphotransferase [Negativicutes bacterium]|jgi:polyphosphate:AMP phosphotransferase
MLEKVDLSKTIDKEEYKELVDELRRKLALLQRQARDAQMPVVIVFEGWDAAGKGTLINELILSLDPRGFNVYPTHEPNEDEQFKPYLWRFWTKTPAKGRIAIFDRSWYRRVLQERVDKLALPQELHNAFHDIPAFERQLAEDGNLIIKFFLHISKKEQKERLKKLADDPATAWRVSEKDWKHHKEYNEYLQAIEEMIQKTDASYAPWAIVEAHDKRFAVVKILTTVVTAIERQLNKKLAVCAVPQVLTAADKLDKKFNSSILSEVDLTKTLAEDEYQEKLKKHQDKIRELEYVIYSKRLPVIIAFEGWDAAGKGGAIRRLTQNMDPRGYTVVPVASPTEEEKNHHYLWRFWKTVPKAGHIALFDRSWYGRVLVERVEGFCLETDWRRAYKEINEMEEQWVNYGAVLVKFWMHIDQDEQQKRFEERLANPDKHWKITEEDWRNREKWSDYETAVDEMFFRTSTTYAPWNIVEANSKYYARIKVLETVIAAVSKQL